MRSVDNTNIYLADEQEEDIQKQKIHTYHAKIVCRRYKENRKDERGITNRYRRYIS